MLKKGFFYQDRLRKKERSYIKYLLTENNEDIEFVSDNPDNLNIMLDYMINLYDKKSKFYSYITRRWDLFHVMGATEISILLGMFVGLFLKLYCAYNIYLPIANIAKLNISSITINLFEILLLRDVIIIIIGIIFMIIFHISKVRIAYERDTMLNILIRNIDKNILKECMSKLGTICDDFFKKNDNK